MYYKSVITEKIEKSSACYCLNLRKKTGFDQGSSTRLVLPILGERRAWREIHNLYMRFVILKVRNPLLCTVSSGHLYVIVCSPGSWDWNLWTLHFTNSIIVFLFYLHIFNYNMDTRFVGHAVCTYFIPFISYLFYFIFKTDSMPKDSLFSSSILAWKQYQSNAQTVTIFTWNLNDDLWCLV